LTYDLRGKRHHPEMRRTLSPMATSDGKRIEYRTCHLCEATCGLELHIEDRAITLVRGDKDDVFQSRLSLSQGHGAEAARSRPGPDSAPARPQG